MVGNGIEMSFDSLIDYPDQNLRQGYNWVKYDGTASKRKMGIFGS